MTLEEIKKIPKVELHLHIDGSLEIERAMELSKKDNYNEVENLMVEDDNCGDLNDYLKKFDFPVSLMQSKENLYIVAKDLADYLEKENVIYAEVRFAPIRHISNDLSLDDVVESVLKGIKANKNVKINLILCMMRGASNDDNMNIIYLAKKYLGKGVCGLDLAGAEGLYPTNMYQDLFNEAKKLGIPFTIHAGEVRGADEVYTAISYGAHRIGHGIHAITDANVLNYIKDNNITLEVCPTSNVQTNAVPSYQMHPIKSLNDYGIKVTINTDNKTVSNVSLCGEYFKLSKTFGFTIDDFKKFNINAINAAFITDEEKQELLNRL